MKPSTFSVLAALSALTLTLLAAAPSVHAQSLLNGSFESPSAGGPGSIETMDPPTYWDANGPIAVVSNGTSLGDTPYGDQYLLLDTSASISQEVTGFSPGSLDSFSVAAANIIDDNAEILTLSVSGSATATEDFLLPPSPANSLGEPLPLVTYTLDFVPTDDGAVTFTITNSVSANYFAVDNAVLSVPEPSTWALLGVGALGAGGVARRRRRVVS